MRIYTHLAFGLFIAGIADIFFDVNTILFYFLCGLGSLLPDMDLVIRFLHRKALHSIWLAIVVPVIAYIIYPASAMPLALGIISHLALDSTTITGVRLFYPFRKKTRGRFKTGTIIDTILMIFFSILAMLLFLINNA